MSAREGSEMRRGHRLMWAAGLVVVGGAGLLTAHGLIEVAKGSTVPESIAWLYPVITDGLALVAYAATSRLSGAGRRYAWSVVVLAAGLSAIAQASFLAAGQPAASAQLRFAVGAWPAVGAAIAAHLLFLIGEVGRAAAPNHRPPVTERDSRGVAGAVSVNVLGTSGHRPGQGVPPAVPAVPSGVSTGVRGVPPGVQVDQAGVQEWDSKSITDGSDPAGGVSQSGRRPGMRPALAPGDRAVAMAELHRARNGDLPSVRELASLAEVSRGTAETALRQIRNAQAQLHLVEDEPESRSRP
ncbi:hypothetical protein ACTXG6_43505 [Pseudonocardia sp. Cha107L01]|uniref:hypothetical protein n=1 Tax=Pseudonocardia sp. Cha107L01 TaxID=3457576 RepID=UPI00403E937A